MHKRHRKKKDGFETDTVRIDTQKTKEWREMLRIKKGH